MKKSIFIIYLLISCCIYNYAGNLPEAKIPYDAELIGNISSITISIEETDLNFDGSPVISIKYYIENQLVKEKSINSDKTTLTRYYTNGIPIHIVKYKRKYKNSDLNIIFDNEATIELDGNSTIEFTDKNNKIISRYKEYKLIERTHFQYSEREKQWNSIVPVIYYEYNKNNTVSRIYKISSKGSEYDKKLYFYNGINKNKSEESMNETIDLQHIPEIFDQLKYDIKISEINLFTKDLIPIYIKKQYYSFAFEVESTLSEEQLKNIDTEVIKFNETGLPIIHCYYRSHNLEPYLIYNYEYQFDIKGNWTNLNINRSYKNKDIYIKKVTRKITYLD